MNPKLESDHVIKETQTYLEGRTMTIPSSSPFAESWDLTRIGRSVLPVWYAPAASVGSIDETTVSFVWYQNEDPENAVTLGP